MHKLASTPITMDCFEMDDFSPLIDNYKLDLSWKTIIDYCEQKDIHLRIVWMPWNEGVEEPQIALDVRRDTNEMLLKHNVEILDLVNELDGECFHDAGHLDYNVGAPIFTKLINNWL